MAAINKFYERTLDQETPQIGVYAKADIPRAMLTRQFVFVLSIAVLPDLVKDNFDNHQMDENSETYWYNYEDVVGEIRWEFNLFLTSANILFFSNAWRNLRLFFQYNNYKVKFLASRFHGNFNFNSRKTPISLSNFCSLITPTLRISNSMNMAIMLQVLM